MPKPINRSTSTSGDNLSSEPSSEALDKSAMNAFSLPQVIEPSNADNSTQSLYADASKLSAVSVNPSAKQISLAPDFESGTIEDVIAIGRYRTSYNKQTSKEKHDYLDKVRNIAADFSRACESMDWNEDAISQALFSIANKHDYPNVLLLDALNTDIPSNVERNNFFRDYIELKDTSIRRMSRSFGQETRLLFTDALLKKELFRTSKGTKDYRISINGQDILYMRVFPADMSKRYPNMIDIKIYRQSVHKFTKPTTDTTKSLERKPKFYDYVRINLAKKSSVLNPLMNTLANRLLNGEFADRNEAVNMLLNYKLLTCLSFIIEGTRGTQFANIVKMNYLSNKVFERYPDKIKEPIRIPHLHSDPNLFEPNSQSPEIACVIKHPVDFLSQEKRQVRSTLDPNIRLDGPVNDNKKPAAVGKRPLAR